MIFADENLYEYEDPYIYPHDEPDDCGNPPSDTEDDPDPVPVNNTRQLKTQCWQKGESRLQAVLAVLSCMTSHNLNLPLFLEALFYGDRDCHSDRRCIYARTSLTASDEFSTLLKVWYKPPRRPDQKKGKRPTGGTHAMEEFALKCVSDRIDADLQKSVPLFLSSPEDFSEESLLNTDLTKLRLQVQSTNHSLWTLLQRAAYTESQQLRNKHKNPDMVSVNTVLMMIAQIQYTRSSRRARLQKLWAIYLKSCGLSARAFDALHTLGIVMSHKWTANALHQLSDRAIELVRNLILVRAWNMQHDNLNVARRAFSQRLHNQSHFISATAGTVWVHPEHVKLSPDINRIYQKFLRENRSTLFDIEPLVVGDPVQDQQINLVYVNIVLQVLLQRPEFQDYYKEHCNDPALSPPEPVCQLSGGEENVVRGFILRTIDQEEASYDGTMKVIEAFLRELELSSPEETVKTGLERLIPWLGDQLTVDRIRGMWRYRHEDDNSFERLDFIIPIFGWFHLIMAFAKSLHDQYLGTSSTAGGLRHAFDLLNRKGLITPSIKGPFWHHLDEAIHHISEAHFLASWLAITESKNISDLTSFSPSMLKTFAQELVRCQASRGAVEKERNDPVLSQMIMWNVDVLPYLDLRQAIKSGDVGRMENLLPTLALRFNGGNNSNYFGEVIGLLQGLKQEWPEEIRNYIRRWCWIFTRTGKSDSWLAFDLGQEENICDIKYTYKSSGPGATIDYIGDISPAIPTMRNVQRHVESQFKTSSRGAKHGVPDKTKDVELLLSNYTTNALHLSRPGRKGYGDHKAKDIMTAGAANIENKINAWFEKRTLSRSEQEDFGDR
ncbi:hypothetical protein K435DRAFT_654164 [Dendrothele bispora CBS 962.96]|uniref:DUF6589 domain-containing protein n=1 Tax=Dendrothele bispora (strain CBS 962.96) TaxID=1314807 RepID=A0A4S8MH71_DENBC|nr:hypothetical protein K435DRAFT_654164 [Dendrothele bispora CBS 962.96]